MNHLTPNLTLDPASRVTAGQRRDFRYGHVIEIAFDQGQQIENIKLSGDSNKINIDFSNINKGTYFLKINYTNKKSVIKKIIK